MDALLCCFRFFLRPSCRICSTCRATCVVRDAQAGRPAKRQRPAQGQSEEGNEGQQTAADLADAVIQDALGGGK